MIAKNFLLSLLLLVPILLLTFSCGSNNDDTEQRTEDLVGRWEFVSFAEQSVDERIDAFFDDTGVKVNPTQNSLVFDQEGSWSRVIGGEFVGDLSNVIKQATLLEAKINFSE